MSLEAILMALRRQHVHLWAEGGDLVFRPLSALTEAQRNVLREHKADLLNLPAPYINKLGDLVIPTRAAPQYYWQPITSTLRELAAPPGVWQRYTTAPYPADLAIPTEGTTAA